MEKVIDRFNRFMRIELVTVPLLLLGTSLTVLGQNTLFEKDYLLSAGLGYNFSTAGGTLGTNSTNESFEGIYGSWAQGMAAHVDLGLRTCENLFTLFSWNYFNGRSIESSSRYDNPNSSYHQSATNHLTVPLVLTVGSRYYVDPDCFAGLIGSFSIFDKVTPYLGIGGGLAMGSRMRNQAVTESFQNNIESSLEISSVTRFKAAGILYGELGISFDYSNRLSFVAGLRGNSLSLINSKARIRSYVEDGVDITDQLTTAELETEYFRELDLNEVGFTEKPSKQLAERHPASGLTFSVGVLYDINQAGKLPPINPGGLGGFVPPRGRVNRPDPGRIKLPPDVEIKPKVVNDICQDCPPIKLKISSNNDKKEFPAEDIIVIRKGPWGGATLKNVSILTKKVLCNQCPGSGAACCCRIDSLYVYFTFTIFINEIKINKGVWLNTNANDEKNFGSTKTGKSLPEDLAHKEDWKLVDRKSVEIHERQHFADLQVMLTEVLEKELEKFVVLQRPCSQDALEVCEQRIDKYLAGIAKKLNKLVKNEARAIAASENKDYSKSSELEKRARSVQAVELNGRGE